MSSQRSEPGSASLRGVWARASLLALLACGESSSFDHELDLSRVRLSWGEPPDCHHAAGAASARGLDLERMARAHWERVAFAADEGPRAIDALAEAESCYAAAGERVERLRVQGQRTAYQRELSRSFEATRLSLDIALREREPARGLPLVSRLLSLGDRSTGFPTKELQALRRRLERAAYQDVRETQP